MNKKTKIRLAISAIIFTICLMWFGHKGSFDPRQVGFYTSLGAGLLWYAGMFFIFRKLSKSSSSENLYPEDPEND